MNERKIKLYIADDHHVVRKGLVSLIRGFPRIGVIKEADNGKDLIKLVEEDQPDIVVIDVRMPIIDGPTASEHILEKFPSVRILVLSAFEEESIVSKLLEIGVNGYLLKKANPKELETAIYSVYDNDFYQNELTSKVLRNTVLRKRSKSFGGRKELSDREDEVLKLLCQELSVKEIAHKLNLSEKTIHTHRTHLLEKTGAKNLVGLVLYAFENGILQVKS
jgi:two-component system response regulator DegU